MDTRVQELKDWIEREGRMQKWVAQQIGCSPQSLKCQHTPIAFQRLLVAS